MTTATPATLRNKAFDAVQLALGDLYDCKRSWSAWNEGTMTADDFSPVYADYDRVVEIVDAVLDAVDLQVLLEERNELRAERDNLRRMIAHSIDDIKYVAQDLEAYAA